MTMIGLWINLAFPFKKDAILIRVDGVFGIMVQDKQGQLNRNEISESLLNQRD